VDSLRHETLSAGATLESTKAFPELVPTRLKKNSLSETIFTLKGTYVIDIMMGKIVDTQNSQYVKLGNDIIFTDIVSFSNLWLNHQLET